MKYLIIENGAPRITTSPATLADIRRVVGGEVECLLQYTSDEREDVDLTVYSNEEGRRLGMAPNVCTDVNSIVLFGPVVVIGRRNGELVGLTNNELAQVAVVQHQASPLPILNVSAEDVTMF